MSQHYYYNSLANECVALDIWDTEHLQVHEGKEPVYKWVSTTELRPDVTALSDEDAGRCVA
jgi:trans-aconitate methyltransferase